MANPYGRVREAIAEVDATNIELARAMAEIIAYRGHLRSPAEIRGLMRQLERELATRYGASRARRDAGAVYTAIARSTEMAAYDAYADFYDRVRHGMRRTDPERWAVIERTLVTAGRSDPFAYAVASLSGPHAQWQAYLRSQNLDPNRRWVDPKGYRLSDRVWGSGREIRSRIDQTLRAGMRNGLGPESLARDIEFYMSAANAPIEYGRDGSVRYRKDREPDGGKWSTRSRVLARTEVSQMHFAATAASVESSGIEGAGVRWALSAAHPKQDICDEYASYDGGLGPGVYLPRDVPHIPHPQCMCSLQPAMPSRRNVLEQLWSRYGS